jgi:hypothetical protein
MVLRGNHNRNDRLGQSLFTVARRPWPLFVAWRSSAGAFFVRTSARGCRRGAKERCVTLQRDHRRVQMRSSTSLWQKYSSWRRASRVDGGVCRIAAGLVWDSRSEAFTRAYHPICASCLILTALMFQGQIHAWSVADAHGSLSSTLSIYAA